MMPAIFQRWATSVRQPLIAVTFIVALYLIAIAHAQSPATQPQDGASIQQHIAELKAQSDALPLNDPRHGDFAVQILDLKQTLKKLQSSDAQPSTQPSGVVDRQTLETRLADLDKSQTAIKSQIDALNQSINAAQSDVAMYKESANKYAVGRLANAEAGIPAGADTNVANGSRETGKAIAAQRKLDALSRQLGALNATNARDDELRQRLQSQLDNLSDPVTSAQIAEYRQKRLDEIDKMERKGTERSMAARGPGKHFDVASYASAQRLEIAQESDWKIAAEIRDARKITTCRLSKRVGLPRSQRGDPPLPWNDT